MKKSIYLICSLFILLLCDLNAQKRYLDPIFSGVKRDSFVYASNFEVLSGAPVLINLPMDVYTPIGDTATNRPLVILFHTGIFLPTLPNPLNGGIAGNRRDSVLVEIATRLAKMGYVVASVEYRLGWNPVSPDINVRVNTLLNATYRGIQDARSCVRYFRKNVKDGGNSFGIDPNKVVYFGDGTGGYISLGAATLDKYSDIVIPKFIGPDITGDGIPDPFVIQPIHGDPFGTTLGVHPATQATLCKPNTVTYNDGSAIGSDVALTVNLGGALGDTSWLDKSDPPVISFHVPIDPFAPYKSGVLIVPTTGDQIVEVQGSYWVQRKADSLGVNSVFELPNPITDAYSVQANKNNEGFDGLYPVVQGYLPNPFTGNPYPQSGPWQWWESAIWSTIPHPSCPTGAPVTLCNFHVINSIGNQTMSAAKGRTYVDTIIGYYAPRAYRALQLWPTSSEEYLKGTEFKVTIAPIPASSEVYIQSEVEQPILGIEMFDVNGRRVRNIQNINNVVYSIDRDGLANGVYFMKLRFKAGLMTRKVVFH